MVSIFAKARICRGNKQVHLQFFVNQNFIRHRKSATQMDRSNASSKISFHGLPSKSKRRFRKHSVVVNSNLQIDVWQIFFHQYFCELLENSSSASKYVSKISFRKYISKSWMFKKIHPWWSLVSKVAGFYRSNHRMRFVKNVFLERCSQISQEKACVRDSIFKKLHS